MYLSTSFNNYQHLSILFALFSPMIFFRGWIVSNFCILLCYVNNIILRHSPTTQCFCWLFEMFIHVFMSSCKEFILLLYRIPLYAYTITYLSIPQWLTLKCFPISCAYKHFCNKHFLIFSYACVWEFLYYIYLEVK